MFDKLMYKGNIKWLDPQSTNRGTVAAKIAHDPNGH